MKAIIPETYEEICERIEMKRYVSILSPKESFDHAWNGNEEKGSGTHHGAIPYSTEPVTIKLTWAKNTESPSRYVGTFQLYLNQLLEDDFISNDAKEGYVRVKFVNVHGVIRIARGKKTDRYLVVGDF